MDKIFYAEGLGYWSTEKESFIDQPDDNADVINVGISKNENALDALKKLLKFEGYSGKKLENETNQLELLVNQNRDYLLKIFILTSLGIEIPDEAMERFVSIKNKMAIFSDSEKMKFLSL